MCWFKFVEVENIFWQTEQVVLPVWLPAWFCSDFLLENVLKQTSQENCFELQVLSHVDLLISEINYNFFISLLITFLIAFIFKYLVRIYMIL